MQICKIGGGSKKKITNLKTILDAYCLSGSVSLKKSVIGPRPLFCSNHTLESQRKEDGEGICSAITPKSRGHGMVVLLLI